MRRSLRGRDAALARSDAGIRRLDRKNESAAVDEALPPRKAAPRGLTAVMRACRVKGFASRSSHDDTPTFHQGEGQARNALSGSGRPHEQRASD